MAFRPTELNQPIPEGVTSLDLSDNSLGQRNGDELVAIMKAIPQSVTSLDLCCNDLGQRNGDELVAIMKAIPSSVTTLDLRSNGLIAKTVEELEQISRCLPYVINIHCEELSQEKLTALTRYNGHGIKATISDLTKELPLQESPPQDAPWLNRYRVGAFFSIASAIAEVIILLACDIAIKTALMWAGVIGCPIVLGVIAAVGFYLLFEPNSNQTILSATV
jgi:hypothetical protein